MGGTPRPLVHRDRQNGDLPDRLGDQNARQTGRDVKQNVESLLGGCQGVETDTGLFFGCIVFHLLAGEERLHVHIMEGSHFVEVDRPVGLFLHDCNVRVFKKTATWVQK